MVASKNKLNERVPAELMQMRVRSPVTCQVDPLSPLIRKIVICEEKDNIIEVTHASSCSGFNCSPVIEWAS